MHSGGVELDPGISGCDQQGHVDVLIYEFLIHFGDG